MGMREMALGLALGLSVLPATAQQATQDQLDVKAKEAQALAEQLKDMAARLRKLEEEIAVLKRPAEKPAEKPPAAKPATSVTGYVQTQYRDSDLPGQNDGFRVRRARVSLSHKADPRTQLKVSFDLAGSQFGSSLNEPVESTGQLRDAILSYDVVPSEVNRGVSVSVGRMPVPLGYEIERSSSEREMPERAQYSQVMFSGERSTGVVARHGLGPNALVYAGAMNALTYNDPQQRTAAGPVGNRLAAVGGIRYFSKHLNAGISGLFGERLAQYGAPSSGIVNPTNDRRFVYVDATYSGLLNSKVSVKGEAMFGHDRLPSASASAANVSRDMQGLQLQLGYQINPRNQVNVRYETFDPNTGSDGDLFTNLGLSYLYWIHSGARLMLAHESIEDDARTSKKRYGITTMRVQFKF